jgi:catechol 2,3-dioxygenase-like lactoylglutathione lyase family enzyme
MDQRISLITLGYRDYQRARDFYTALGWADAVAPDDEVVFFQAGCMIFSLWDRAKLATDSGVEDAGGWARADRRRHRAAGRGQDLLGRLLGDLRRP